MRCVGGYLHCDDCGLSHEVSSSWSLGQETHETHLYKCNYHSVTRRHMVKQVGQEVCYVLVCMFIDTFMHVCIQVYTLLLYLFSSLGTVIGLNEFRDGDIVKVQQNSFFDATFYLNTSKCRHSLDFFRVKVLYSQENFSVDVCNVIFQHHICDITDMSAFCFCKNDSKKSVRLYREFKVSGNVFYIWKLSESPNGHVQKKAQITFDVASKQLHCVSLPDCVL